MKLKKILSALLAVLLIISSAAVTVSALEAHGTGILLRKWLTNDPDYTFSEAYKETVWHDNFSILELSGNQRNDILSIAVSQLGYHEGEDGDYSGTNTASSGNCVEYYRLLIPTWSNNSDEWCACFVNWCLNQAHIDYASSEIGCWKWVEELKGMKMFEDSAAYGGTYTPQPADMIFFNWKETNTGSGHIGYVLYTTETHVFTIEGNADNNVTVRSYALDSKSVIGYGTPPYEEGDVPTVDHSYKNGMPRGEYVLNAAGVNLTETKTSGRLARLPLGARVTLLDEDGDHAHVSYDGKVGYIKKANLYLLTQAVGEDTLTYDANGGEGAPEAVAVTVGTGVTVTDAQPTRKDDTFLGWSYVPYNCKVDVKAGDTVYLSGDATLYAVWEKYSLELAKDAMADGKIVEFERPESIQNSAALLLGTLPDLAAFDTSKGDTKVDFHEDEEAGRVLAFSATAESEDPYTTLSYKKLCDSLGYAPVDTKAVTSIVLKVKDVSMSNLSFELFYDCGNGGEHSLTRSLRAVDGWQYIEFNLAYAEGWDGTLESLRLDWQRKATEAGSTMLISDIYFATSDEMVDAIKNGAYVYPPMEKQTVNPSTDGESTEDTSSLDVPVGPADTVASPEPGCASVAGISALLGILTVGAAVLLRKKEN